MQIRSNKSFLGHVVSVGSWPGGGEQSSIAEFTVPKRRPRSRDPGAISVIV